MIISVMFTKNNKAKNFYIDNRRILPWIEIVLSDKNWNLFFNGEEDYTTKKFSGKSPLEKKRIYLNTKESVKLGSL